MTTHSPLAYDRLNENLAEAIPALVPALRAELEWWGREPGPSHVVFARVLG